jgi:hypothetical protein
MNDYHIPYWLWLLQYISLRFLGIGIAVYETVNGHNWEGYVFAGWLFLLPDVVKGREANFFKLLTGSNNEESKNS